MLLVVWALCLIFAFALIEWGLGSHTLSQYSQPGFTTDLYVSGVTFFTLGYGDVVPDGRLDAPLLCSRRAWGSGFSPSLSGICP